METKDSLSRPLLTEVDGINMLLHNVELKDNEFVETDDVKMYNLHCEELDLFELPLLGKEIDKDLFDTQRQREWYIPKHYKELDIVEYIAKLCPNEPEPPVINMDELFIIFSIFILFSIILFFQQHL